jgi:aprataxin and PNK-like factor
LFQINKGTLLVEGEKEALEGDKTVYFTLLPERSYKEGSADQIRFRLAESQFYRRISGDERR